MKLKAIANILHCFSMAILFFSILLFTLSLPALKTVATDTFDIIRWLDADVWIMTGCYYGLIFSLVANIASFLIKIYNQKQ